MLDKVVVWCGVGMGRGVEFEFGVNDRMEICVCQNLRNIFFMVCRVDRALRIRTKYTTLSVNASDDEKDGWWGGCNDDQCSARLRVH